VSRINTIIRRPVQPIHHHFRSGKNETFLRLLSTQQPGTLLDVGGGTGRQLVETEYGPDRVYESLMIIFSSVCSDGDHH
jgi:hypothetical protein